MMLCQPVLERQRHCILHLVPAANTDAHVLFNAPIPVGSTIEILSGNKVVLQTTDILKIDCSVTDKVSAVLSIMEIT